MWLNRPYPMLQRCLARLVGDEEIDAIGYEVRN